ncbi:50S ribosomal protein L5 [bacterium]|nr:50S ribosomal protein L5 [bacterium]
MARLHEKYKTKLIAALQQELGCKNALAVPRLERIVVSMGVKNSHQDRKKLDEAIGHLATITGQQPKITRAKHSIAGFRLREGNEIGCCVTLRRHRMYEFLDRLISIALPRVRDFRGLNPKAFDGNGNFSMGLTEQLVFPEVDPDKAHNIQGMNITIVTTADSNESGLALLKAFGLPFKKAQTAA